jgi:hypothetical protein
MLSCRQHNVITYPSMSCNTFLVSFRLALHMAVGPRCMPDNAISTFLLVFNVMCAVQVYDVTSYIDDHPGGADSILQNAGVDCTDEFMGVHSQVRQHSVSCMCRKCVYVWQL